MGSSQSANLRNPYKFAKRQEFLRTFLEEKLYSSYIMSQLKSCDRIQWAIMLACSSRLRQFIQLFDGDVHSEYELYQELEQTFIIEPVTDLHIHEKIKEVCRSFRSIHQVGGTCWACAIATGIYLSSIRIVGRHVDDVLSIRDSLVNQFGNRGQITARL